MVFVFPLRPLRTLAPFALMLFLFLEQALTDSQLRATREHYPGDRRKITKAGV